MCWYLVEVLMISYDMLVISGGMRVGYCTQPTGRWSYSGPGNLTGGRGSRRVVSLHVIRRHESLHRSGAKVFAFLRSHKSSRRSGAVCLGMVRLSCAGSVSCWDPLGAARFPGAGVASEPGASCRRRVPLSPRRHRPFIRQNRPEPSRRRFP